ncbi:MAG: phosphatase PAP2 family protein [Ferruginibacter sp.]|nr:phosphatase PAP2 family protein [Ferruginibacter sp.]
MQPKINTAKLYLPAGLLTMFILLAVFIYQHPTLQLDIDISTLVQAHTSAALDAIMQAISWFGNMPYSAITAITASLLFYLFRYKREALFVLLAMLSGAVSSAIKGIVNRPRPLQPLIRVVAKNMQQSFPSGHVMYYVILFGFIAFLMRRLIQIPKLIRGTIFYLCMALVLTISISRIYLGAHWFTDVAGAYLLGSVCLFILCGLYLRRIP